MIDVPEAALPHGFSNARGGATTSRTIMLDELRRLFGATPASASPSDLRAAVVDENVLLKPTQATRTKTFLYLRERYGLDRRLTVYRALRDLWDAEDAAQPLLALLCAAARDPLLRASASAVLPIDPGCEVEPQAVAGAISTAFPDTYNAKTLIETARRAVSSWQQSGHLTGQVRQARKLRARAECRPAAVAYALLLGHLCGAGGEGLFQTFWTQLLDVPPPELREQAIIASQQGWIDYRQAGGVTHVGFRHLLREQEDGGR